MLGHLLQSVVDYQGLLHLEIHDEVLTSIPDGDYLTSLETLDISGSTPDDLPDYVLLAPNLKIVILEGE